MDKLIIDRQRWLRGEGPDRSYLLRASDGKMCCLGFDMLRRGYTPEQIKDVPSPAGFPVEGLVTVTHNFAPTGEPPRYAQTTVCENLMGLNDSRTEEQLEDAEEAVRVSSLEDSINDLESEADRETRIAAEFAKIGIEVEFVG